MRYSIVTLVAAVLTSTFAMAAAPPPNPAPKMDQLAATKHNFNRSGGTYAGSGAYLGVSPTGEKYTVCQPCHTPHHAILDGTGARDETISGYIWNHAMSNATYTLFSDTAATGQTGAFTGQTDGSQGMDRTSRLCLGCHDGTIALDAFGMNGRTSNVTNKFLATDVNNLGIDFRDDHPVGITGKVTDLTGAVTLRNGLPSFKTPTLKTTNGVLSVKMPVVGAAYDTSLSLYNITGGTGFYVGCRTCHNPHGSGDTNLTPFSHLLNCDPALLCNSCHYK